MYINFKFLEELISPAQYCLDKYRKSINQINAWSQH